MSGEMLQVDPAVLRGGSAKFRTTHLDLRETAGKIDESSAAVQDTWTGDAAETIAASWGEMHHRITVHFDKIAEVAESLVTAADSYTDQENANQNSIQQTRVLKL